MLKHSGRVWALRVQILCCPQGLVTPSCSMFSRCQGATSGLKDASFMLLWNTVSLVTFVFSPSLYSSSYKLCRRF